MALIRQIQCEVLIVNSRLRLSNERDTENLEMNKN